MLKRVEIKEIMQETDIQLVKYLRILSHVITHVQYAQTESIRLRLWRIVSIRVDSSKAVMNRLSSVDQTYRKFIGRVRKGGRIDSIWLESVCVAVEPTFLVLKALMREGK